MAIGGTSVKFLFLLAVSERRREEIKSPPRRGSERRREEIKSPSRRASERRREEIKSPPRREQV